jgi:Streptomyces sporulation and cell division protein, SsgA
MTTVCLPMSATLISVGLPHSDYTHPSHPTLPVSLNYDSSDPCAVTLVFQQAGDAVHWVFSRAMLSMGTRVPAGNGDVKILHRLNAGMRWLIVRLHSPYGEVDAVIPFGPVLDFLRSTYLITDAGQETEIVNAELDRMFGQAV